uniref:Uncharacterized protein n=1 Tax=Arundo donax TaxID=35708 RepID=A0A0A9FPL4_ARUDO
MNCSNSWKFRPTCCCRTADGNHVTSDGCYNEILNLFFTSQCH